VDLVDALSAWNLPEHFLTGIDGAINGLGDFANKAYFFKGDEFIRYDWSTGQIDAGYPQSINGGWPALMGLAEATQRRMVLYITIDHDDHHETDGTAGRHAPNFDNLRRIATDWRANTFVDDFWCPQVVSSMLDDPHVLALFLSGSFDEWVEVFRQSTWASHLDRWCALIQAIDMPILAVCGSHQLIAHAYASWEAVGHMANADEAPVPISDEADNVFRAPNPRIGEVGVYSFRSERFDPILTSLPEPMYFVEFHHDQVLDFALPSAATSLLAPDGVDDALQAQSGDPGTSPDHQSISIPQERCRIQALKYDVSPPGRVLYTTQFHPELKWGSTDDQAMAAAEHGPLLIHNFLNIADAYWSTR
jgi:GMP synthase-like glutamine amidotransferase